MKPEELIGRIVVSKRFGRARILSHIRGRRFECECIEPPFIKFSSAWGHSIKPEQK